MTTDFLIDTDQLHNALDSDHIRIFDCTTILKPHPEKVYTVEAAIDTYEAGHIPGAGFLDLQNALSDRSSALRFTLPSPEQFSEVAAAAGISNDNHVILYSTTAPMWATRLWWMFRIFGHERVSVLDGGFAKWQKEGKPVSGDLPAFPRGEYVAEKDTTRVADKQDVLNAITAESCCVLNALSRDQFVGEGQHYGRPGRISHSENLPWSDLIDVQTGCFLPINDLRTRLEATSALASDRVITYCGGGIAASVDLFAMALLGMEHKVALYDNSLSEWVQDPSAPMETG
ncbi:MAG: sulfurtransferase [Pseudomonadales bacterium]